MATPTKDIALKAEANPEEDTKVVFKFEDVEYTYDKQLMIDDSDILESLEEGKMIVPVKSLVGSVQYAAFKRRGKNGKRSMEEVAQFAEAMFAGQDLDLGE
jgi:uncharacterized protein YktA (UPF0223 family)